MEVVMWILSFLKALGLTVFIFWMLVRIKAFDGIIDKATTERRSWAVLLLTVVVFWGLVWLFF